MCLPPENSQSETIRALPDKLQVPMHDVAEIYRSEFDRLAREAGIPTYLDILATSRTRSILREDGKRAILR